MKSVDIDRMVDGQTVASIFLQTLATHGDRVALRERQPDDSWAEWTFAEYAEHVAGATAALRDLGVRPGDRVVLMMRNVAAFHMVDLAAVFCGATPISIYNSSSPEQIAYLAGHCEAKLAIVEDDGFAERFEKVRGQLNTLEQIVTVADDAGELFHGHGLADLEEGATHVTPDTLATVIYTSGTTGPPKGVMLSHYNIAWTAESLKRAFGDDIDLTGYRVVSYLPMAHIAERMTSHYQQAINAYEVTVCPDAGQVATYFKEVRPQIAFGVPRVWEKISAGVMAAIAADPDNKRQFDEGIEA
ncbi:MAG: long-chain acyl-CoA synthetase, partial [Acidimicrobiaceae bacterium]